MTKPTPPEPAITRAKDLLRAYREALARHELHPNDLKIDGLLDEIQHDAREEGFATSVLEAEDTIRDLRAKLRRVWEIVENLYPAILRLGFDPRSEISELLTLTCKHAPGDTCGQECADVDEIRRLTEEE